MKLVGVMRGMIGAGLAALLLGGCATHVSVPRWKPAEMDLKGVGRMAVAPFIGLTPAAMAEGRRIREDVERGLRETGRFELYMVGPEGMVVGLPDALKKPSATNSVAVMTGRVIGMSSRSEVTSAESKCTREQKVGDTKKTVEYACMEWTHSTRVEEVIGVRIHDMHTGQLLGSRRLSRQASAEAKKKEQAPPAPEPQGLFQRTHQDLVGDVLRLVAPFRVWESIQLQKTSKLPDLKLGNEYAKHGEWEQALGAYHRADAQAAQNPTLSPAIRARPPYNIGVALACLGDIEGGLASLRRASALAPEDYIFSAIHRLEQWQADVRRVSSQMSGQDWDGGE